MPARAFLGRRNITRGYRVAIRPTPELEPGTRLAEVEVQMRHPPGAVAGPGVLLPRPLPRAVAIRPPGSAGRKDAAAFAVLVIAGLTAAVIIAPHAPVTLVPPGKQGILAASALILGGWFIRREEEDITGSSVGGAAGAALAAADLRCPVSPRGLGTPGTSRVLQGGGSFRGPSGPLASDRTDLNFLDAHACPFRAAHPGASRERTSHGDRTADG